MNVSLEEDRLICELHTLAPSVYLFTLLTTQQDKWLWSSPVRIVSHPSRIGTKVECPFLGGGMRYRTEKCIP